MFERLFRSLLVNPEAALPQERPCDLSEWDPDDGAELLVISYPYYTDEFQPWTDWKLLKGIPTLVVTTETTGNTRTDIKNYILNAYNTWTIPPVYVLFLGDADKVTTHSNISYHGCVGDNEFCCVDGSDYIPDVIPGRLSCDEPEQVEVIVQKLLNYEMHPDTTDDWFLRYVGVVNEEDCPYDGGPTDSSYRAAIFYGEDCCSDAGFTSLHIFHDCYGHDSLDVKPYIEEGCGILAYRGSANYDWASPFNNINVLPTGVKCPVTLSITCLTAVFHNSDDRICERSIRGGTTADPMGSVAFIGQGAASTNSLERSMLMYHIFEALFEEEIIEIGAAHTYGKIGMHEEFGWDDDACEWEFLTAILHGSPEMLTWTGPIHYPSVVVPPAVLEGPNDVDVNVAVAGAPVEGARVTLRQNTSFSYAISDASGDATVSKDIDPTVPLVLVVTGQNIYPYIDTIDVIVSGVAVYCAAVDYDDITGDGDGLINPGETIRFLPKLLNMGTEGTGGLSAIFRCPDVIWIDSISAFPYLASGDTVTGDEVVFTVPEGTPSTGALPIIAHITGHASGPWDRDIVPEAAVHRFNAYFDHMTIDDPTPYGDGDGEVDPGETVNICLGLSNNSLADAFDVEAYLLDIPNMSVIQNYGGVDIWPRSTLQELTPCFTTNFSPENEPGSNLILPVYITGNGSMYSFSDTIQLYITITGQITGLPSGPDSYGYYIIDDTDTVTHIQPAYSWDDISSPPNELDPVSDSDDLVQFVELPFTMSYYGEDFDTITVASNGFISPGQDDWSGSGTGTPHEIPTIGGPEGIIAPCWADLAPHRHDGGEIYGYYDSAGGQYIIQWDYCEFYYGGGRISAQLKICDPAIWPTPTGDSEFFIYYEYWEGLGVMGNGMESPSEIEGIEYHRNGIYEENAAEITSGRALRITTLEPHGLSSPWLHYAGDLFFDDSLTDNDGLIEPGDRVGIRLRIRNGGSRTAQNVSGEVISSALVSPSGSSVGFGTLSPGNEAYNSGSSMKCEISLSCPSDTVIEIPILFSETSVGYSTIIKVLIKIGSSVGIDEDLKLPRGIHLGKPFPNPFNDVFSIEITVGEDVEDELYLELFDITGRKVDTVHRGELSSGRYTFRVECDDLPSGIYFTRLRSSNDVKTEKLLHLQ